MLSNEFIVASEIVRDQEVCGTTENIHAHHPDYNKPLETVGLCDPCHIGFHKPMAQIRS